jgi:myo-inositol-1-phosphate synthase
MTVSERTGVWIVGARGSVATCLVYGVAGLRRKVFDETGLVTARGPCADLDLVDPRHFVFGGHEVRRGSILESARSLVATAVLPASLVEAAREEGEAVEARIRPGFVDRAQEALSPLDREVSRRMGLAGAEVVERLRADLRAFREAERLARVVVVHLASTESIREIPASWARLRGLERDLRSSDPERRPPPSVLYALAAVEEGCPLVNFTPSPGPAVGGVAELARARGVPFAGNDGKTGETLVKGALAPLFLARNLRVLSWEGYNLLGNRDGAVLSDPAHRAAKVRSKDEALRRLLADPSAHTGVTIDFVPSLREWKTAWDFIHFRGFLGVTMSLQFTWQGCDSALAAPLVIDLVRLADLSARRGEAGALAHTACFFKSPIGVAEADFHRQAAALDAYARDVAGSLRSSGPGRPRGGAATPRSRAARRTALRRRGTRTRRG